jgi:predicted transcriptional regulator
MINMKRININHLRVLKHFSNKTRNYKISDYEKFLITYVSLPTARKIIKELIELKIVSVVESKHDLRVKYLSINQSDINKFI